MLSDNYSGRKLPGQRVPEVADLQEVDTMLAETVQEWTKQWQAEGWTKGWTEGMEAGRQDGRTAGRQDGEATLLQRQLQRRFGSPARLGAGKTPFRRPGHPGIMG